MRQCAPQKRLERFWEHAFEFTVKLAYGRCSRSGSCSAARTSGDSPTSRSNRRWRSSRSSARRCGPGGREASCGPSGGRPTSRDALTPAEQRVAEQAASGLTNREVAAVLFISPKTVESTLARAYRKLKIRSRAELGAHIAARAASDEEGNVEEKGAGVM
jgi:DNA-binding CsgD family transcriptional regulator